MFSLFKLGAGKRTSRATSETASAPKPRAVEDRRRIYAMTDSREAAETAKAGLVAALERDK